MINPDGSVRLRSADIIAAKGRKQNRVYEAFVLMFSDRSCDRQPYSVNLDSMVQHLPNSDLVYAVSLYGNVNYQHGFILQGAKTFLSFVTWLVKAGAFFACSSEMPPTSTVN